MNIFTYTFAELIDILITAKSVYQRDYEKYKAEHDREMYNIVLQTINFLKEEEAKYFMLHECPEAYQE